MSGRRAYQRFRGAAPLDGRLRISRDVTVQAGDRTRDLAVLSDAPGVVGEELTLALVNGAGQMEFVVRVAESQPQIVQGALRHRLRLEIISPVPDRRAAAERGE